MGPEPDNPPHFPAFMLCYDRTNRQDAVHAEVSIGYSSIVDVDPNFAEAKWLRTKIQDMAKRDRVIVPFPIDTWDIQLAMHGPGRTLYTLAEVEEQVRNPDPAANFTGKLSVVILDMNLMNNWRKATMCCTECCGIPLYSNRPTATCKNCDSQQTLSVNPRVLGSFLDESGQVSGHKLIWNNEAWTQLLFGEPMDESPKTQALDNATKRSWQDITTFDANTLRDLEAKLLYSRVALTFGWSIELGRLCILGVEW